MNLENQFELEHLFLTERICRTCKVTKNLIDGFYRTRKSHTLSSSYSYECKECTIKRVKATKKKPYITPNVWEYPDW